MKIKIVTTRSSGNAGRITRPASFAVLVVIAGSLLLSSPADAQRFDLGNGPSAISSFYEARGGAPLWLAAGQTAPAVRLIGILANSGLDGLDPAQFNVPMLEKAVRRAEGGRRADIIRADRMLSEAFARYVAALRESPSSEWQVVDPEAGPRMPPIALLLSQAAASGSMSLFLDRMPWMHESYAGLRRALAEAESRGERVTAERLRINLERVRGLPSTGRYVLVNTAAQRLYMYEDGRVVDQMRVVVGKPEQPTPMMAALIRFAAVNPYWNVPDDLVGERIAPNVVKQGLGYLHEQRYVVLSDWGENPTRIDPATVDWAAVAAGTVRVRVRQDPGPANGMGQMKFMFPNRQGVYLHDTPNKELLNEEARLFSAGCVRLEDAPRLAKWLYGEPLQVPKGGRPEQRVDLKQPVPVYLAYLTAVPSGSQTVFYNDIYGRDRARLTAAEARRVAAR